MNLKKLWGMNYINMAAAVMFAVLGLIMGRPVIFGLSIALFALGLWSRKQWTKFASPESVLWQKYIAAHPENKKRRYLAWHYGTDKQTADRWARFVRDGRIQGAAYCAWAFEFDHTQEPKTDDYSVILDWDGNAVCIVKTVRVETVPFDQVTDGLARLEGSRNTLEWREEKGAQYKAICARIGLEFSESLPVLFERYEVVFKA